MSHFHSHEFQLGSEDVVCSHWQRCPCAYEICLILECWKCWWTLSSHTATHKNLIAVYKSVKIVCVCRVKSSKNNILMLLVSTTEDNKTIKVISPLLKLFTTHNILRILCVRVNIHSYIAMCWKGITCKMKVIFSTFQTQIFRPSWQSAAHPSSLYPLG